MYHSSSETVYKIRIGSAKTNRINGANRTMYRTTAMQNSLQILTRNVGLLFLLLLLGVQGDFTPAAEAGCKDSAEPGVDWNDCRKRNLIMSGSNLEKSDLAGTDFSATDLRDSNFSGANFHKSNLMRATMAGSTAIRANFEHVMSYRSSFENTDFTDANFNKAELQRANFSGANLSGVSFIKADLGRAKFDGATLKDNNFERANLSRVNFAKAKISGALQVDAAYFLQTNIVGVDFSKVIGMAQWQADMACGDKNTLLPEGLTRPDTWPCVPDEDE